MNAYTLAKERYAALGVDTEAVLETLKNVTVSVHCWQGDDVVGFDAKEALSGGIQTTGNYPGKATTPEQLMADFDEVLRLTPGKKKLNLHASYAIFKAGEFADRDAIQPKHFSRWVAYAKERGLGIDFNPTFFSHSMVKDGLTLSSPDETVRHFWVEHGKRCMAIAEYFAEETGKPCVINFWIPDGYKDYPADRLSPRRRYAQSMDEILSVPPTPSARQSSVRTMSIPAISPRSWTTVTITRRSLSPTRSVPCFCSTTGWRCTSPAPCAGTATMWCSLTTRRAK